MTTALRPLDAFDPQALELLAASDEFHAALYPAISNHLVDPATLMQAEVSFLGLWDGERLLACGAVRRERDPDGTRYGELKRMFVRPEARGQGLSRQIVAALEALLRAEGIALVRLETGIYQPEAIGLYKGLGFAERGPFGDYQVDPLSLFMERAL